MADDDPDLARASFERAIEMAESVGSRFVASVSRVSIAASVGRNGEPAEAARLFTETLRQFRRAGNLTHATTTLRNVVVFLTRIGADRSAMTLLGTLSDEAIKETYGVEQERLNGCRITAVARSDQQTVDRWIHAGRGRSIGDAIGTTMADLANHPSA